MVALMAGCASLPESAIGTLSGTRAAPSTSAMTASQVIAFEPVIGPDTAAAANLGPAIGRAALAGNVSIAATGSDEAALRVKGYLAAHEAGAGTAFSYHWDVLDRDGIRLYRISGQTVAPRSGAPDDPWSAFDADTADRIATDTIAALKTILATF